MKDNEGHIFRNLSWLKTSRNWSCSSGRVPLLTVGVTFRHCACSCGHTLDRDHGKRREESRSSDHEKWIWKFKPHVASTASKSATWCYHTWSVSMYEPNSAFGLNPFIAGLSERLQLMHPARRSLFTHPDRQACWEMWRVAWVCSRQFFLRSKSGTFGAPRQRPQVRLHARRWIYKWYRRSTGAVQASFKEFQATSLALPNCTHSHAPYCWLAGTVHSSADLSGPKNLRRSGTTTWSVVTQ